MPRKLKDWTSDEMKRGRKLAGAWQRFFARRQDEVERVEEIEHGARVNATLDRHEEELLQLPNVTGVGASLKEQEDPFAVCEERFRAQPDDYESSFCFYDAARQRRQWREAAARLAGLLAVQPENHWPRLTLAHVYRRLEPSRAERWPASRAAERASRYMASSRSRLPAEDTSVLRQRYVV